MKITDLIQTEYSEVTQTDISHLKGIRSSEVDELSSAFDTWFNSPSYRGDFWSGRTAENLVEHISYTQEDISIFSVRLSLSEKYQNIGRDSFEKEGIFFSALINAHYKKTKVKETYTLFLSDNCSDLGYLGINNDGATILIRGNAGFNVGENMYSGKIIVTGYSNIGAGIKMMNGEIHLEEALSLGQHMLGGKIFAKNVRGLIGAKMRGGEVHISESYDTIDRECSGNIYFKGELIYSKAKLNQRGKK